MEELCIVGIDLAKNIFQVHGADARGKQLFSRKLNRGSVLSFLSKLPRCLVALEACATSHYWGREISKLDHDVKLIPPAYVKAFVKRQKNDAQAIAEAASRDSMRFVAVKSEEQQAACMAFKTRDLLVRQKTQLINALRGHLAEYGLIAAKGVAHLKQLRSLLEEHADRLPEAVVSYSHMMLEQIADLQEKTDDLMRKINAAAQKDEAGSRLMTIPGIGPITAAAIAAFAPPMETFSKGRDFSAWLGLTPNQYSSGGKERLGRISKMGQRDVRRLLISGAMAVVRWANQHGAKKGSWLERMLAHKPPMLVAVALANKMARIVWALMTNKETYQEPSIAHAA